MNMTRRTFPVRASLWPEWLAPNSPYGSYNVPDVKEGNRSAEWIWHYQ
jgi:hypothetical protein